MMMWQVLIVCALICIASLQSTEQLTPLSQQMQDELNRTKRLHQGTILRIAPVLLQENKGTTGFFSTEHTVRLTIRPKYVTPKAHIIGTAFTIEGRGLTPQKAKENANELLSNMIQSVRM